MVLPEYLTKQFTPARIQRISVEAWAAGQLILNLGKSRTRLAIYFHDMQSFHTPEWE